MKLSKLFSLIVSFVSITIVTSQISQSEVDSYDENGKTALINAALKKDFNQVKSLLEKGANVNLPELKGLKGTPLMYATSTNDLKLCALLIDEGAEINQLDVNNDHALNWATYYGYIPIMKLLIKKGADVELKSKHGTAVDVAFRLWHNDSIAEPFKETVIAKQLSKAEKKLIKAVQNSDYHDVRKLFKSGLSPNVKDKLDTPILHLAIHRNDTEMVNLLIGEEVDINSMNRVGQTALAWAARFGHLDILNSLLKSGSDVNKAGKEYRLTPLMGAAVNGKESVITLLLENNASIGEKDVVNEATALHWSLWYRHTNVAKILLHHGADFKYKALDNTYSAYEVAELSKMDDVLLLMDALKEKTNTLKGSWKIQEIHYEYPDTTYIASEEKHGRFIFSDNNYSLMYNPRMQNRKPFKNLSKPNESEIVYAFRSIVFNAGSIKLKII